MSEIAKCPMCGKEPDVWCRDEEIRIVCCKHAVYSTLGWNQYAAAMELAKTIVESENCKAEDEYKYQEFVERARQYVLEVFK